MGAAQNMHNMQPSSYCAPACGSVVSCLGPSEDVLPRRRASVSLGWHCGCHTHCRFLRFAPELNVVHGSHGRDCSACTTMDVGLVDSSPQARTPTLCPSVMNLDTVVFECISWGPCTGRDIQVHCLGPIPCCDFWGTCSHNTCAMQVSMHPFPALAC